MLQSDFRDPAAFQVSSDTARDITPPSPSTFAVSGTVSGLSSLPSSTNAALVFTSSDNLQQGTFTLDAGGAFTGQLPNGAYTASLFVPIQQTGTLTIYSLGSTTVSNGPVTANFTVSTTAKLSGTVRVSGLSPIPASSSVIASDTLAPTPTTASCIFPLSTSSLTIDPSGAYQLTLATGRSYRVNVSIVLAQTMTSSRIVTFPNTPISQSLSGDATLDINVPALPGNVAISGRVTGPSGQALSGISVVAFTQNVSGSAELSFIAGTTTDAAGSYRLTVLSGTSYRLTFTPTPPAP